MRVLVFFLLLFAVLSFRLPFFSQVLVGEEGSFAALIATPKPSSSVTANGLPQMLSSIINGQRGYYSFQRNIVPYQILEKTAGSIIRSFNVSSWSPKKTTEIVRVSYFAFFLIGNFGLLWRASAGALASVFALYVLTTPLAVGASIQPQIDGSTGVMLLGTAAFLLSLTVSGWPRTAACLAAGFLVGLARHELAFAMFAASSGVIVLGPLVRVHTLPVGVPVALGVLLGVAFSISASPEEYLSGFDTMSRVFNAGLSRWDAFSSQFKLVWPVWALVAVSLVFGVFRYRVLLQTAPRAVIVCFTGIAIAFGFATSGWGGDGFPRYYVPALIALAFSVIEFDRVRPLIGQRLVSYGSIAVLLAGVMWNAVYLAHEKAKDLSITSSPGLPLAEVRLSMQSGAKRSIAEHIIVLGHPALWLLYPKAEFVARDWGVEGARNYLKEAFPEDASRLRVE